MKRGVYNFCLLVFIALGYSMSGKSKIPTINRELSTIPGCPPVVFFQEKFEDINFAARGWYDNSNIAITNTEHIKGSKNSAVYRYPKGSSSTVPFGANRKLFPESETVYVSFWIKYSKNFTGSDKPYHPHEFHLLTNENDSFSGLSYTHLTAYIEQNEGFPLLVLQDGANINVAKAKQNIINETENRATCGCNGVSLMEKAATVSCYPALTDEGEYFNGKGWIAGKAYFENEIGPYYKNDWHHIEAFFKLNSISNMKGNFDGIVRYWYDGQLIIERTNILMRTGLHPKMKFNQFIIAPYIGDGSPVDQTFWLDDLTIGNARP